MATDTIIRQDGAAMTAAVAPHVTEPDCTCGKPPDGVSHDTRCPAHDHATCRACQIIADACRQAAIDEAWDDEPPPPKVWCSREHPCCGDNWEPCGCGCHS